MKEALCKAFCDSVQVRTLPGNGYAVTTPFLLSDGDPILFYLMQSEPKGSWVIEDDGKQVPLLEAGGVRLKEGQRGLVFDALLESYGTRYDANRRTLCSRKLKDEEVAAAALRFIAFLLRIEDLILLSPSLVREAFHDDAIAAIHEKFDAIAGVEEAAPISEKLPGYHADVVLTAHDMTPLAIYLATSDPKALEALVLKMEAEKYRDIRCRIVLLLERSKENPLREATYALAQARLDQVLSFRGVEGDSMAALERLFRAPAGTA